MNLKKIIIYYNKVSYNLNIYSNLKKNEKNYYFNLIIKYKKIYNNNFIFLLKKSRKSFFYLIEKISYINDSFFWWKILYQVLQEYYKIFKIYWILTKISKTLFIFFNKNYTKINNNFYTFYHISKKKNNEVNLIYNINSLNFKIKKKIYKL